MFEIFNTMKYKVINSIKIVHSRIISISMYIRCS